MRESPATCPADRFRAASDIAAVGDPATGLAVYNTRAGGWVVVGGTSAASPLVAALFASIGLGNITAADLAQRTSALFDVTAGSNGPCGTLLCNATTGWDGPTGFGTPSAALLSGALAPPGPGTLAVQISSPVDGDSVDPGFQVSATASGAAVVGLFVDGTLLRTATAAPYVFPTPTSLSFGTHDIQVVAQDAQNNQVVSEIRVHVRFASTVVPPPDPETGRGGGCQVGGDPAPGLTLIAGLLAVRRRRRARRRRRRRGGAPGPRRCAGGRRAPDLAPDRRPARAVSGRLAAHAGRRRVAGPRADLEPGRLGRLPVECVPATATAAGGQRAGHQRSAPCG